MTRSAVWVGALWLACTGHAHAQATCTRADFGKEIITGLAGDNCPKPNEPQLSAIVKRIDDAAANEGLDAAQKSAAYLGALRELRDAYGLRLGWGELLSRGIDAAIAQTRMGEPPQSEFANVRAASEPCVLVTGTHGQSEYACIVLRGAPEPIGPGTIFVLEPYEAALAFRVLAAAHSAISKLNIPEIDKAIARLTQAQERFDNLRRYGYLQYPWELMVDTALAPRSRYEACQTTDSFCSGEAGLDPTSLRAIFLHPGVGLAAQGLGFKGKPSWDTAIALSLEVAGFVSYTESFAHYWGLSAGAIVNDGDFGDTRFGLFVHATRWVHVGYLFSVLRDDTRGDASVFVSMDLGTAFGASFLE